MDLIAYARAEWGRWIADCPRPGCSNAEHQGADPLSGHVGGLTGTTFRCAICVLACPALWPADKEAIDALLQLRPAPQTRNWLPGEPLTALVAENIEHGLMPHVTGGAA